MTHPLVSQLRFTRHEWLRALRGVEEADGRIRLEPMNSISWMVGHLAWHEQWCWLRYAQGLNLVPELQELVGTGRPATTPSLEAMSSAWRKITAAADPYLDKLTTEDLQERFRWKDKPMRETIGTMLLRLTYHYWFHTGEVLAVRQLLGHGDLPEFVGDIGGKGPYRPE
ncbi:MAG: DinB family protein [Chloroflexota bacterium]|nr:MAG: DinB family protein [Chloroflexota bacterium]